MGDKLNEEILQLVNKEQGLPKLSNNVEEPVEFDNVTWSGVTDLLASQFQRDDETTRPNR